MHQHPRAPPVTASPARSPRTNPARTNNPRDQDSNFSRSSSGNNTPSEQGIDMLEVAGSPARGPEVQSRERSHNDKLDLIIRNYFTKAALIILEARFPLPPAFKQNTNIRRTNQWFNIEVDETDILRPDTVRWRESDAVRRRPPPMIIETYIDMGDLTNNQSLVIIDDYGKRWDVEESIKAHIEMHGRGRMQPTNLRIVLERWRLELGEAAQELPRDFGHVLPTTYKNSVVLFRSLWAYVRAQPAWKLYKRSSKPRAVQAMPKLQYRIVDGSQFQEPSAIDELTIPLHDSRSSVTQEWLPDPIISPGGTFSVKVTYRNNCDFRVDTSEAMLSSRFMGLDEDLFQPSLPHSSASEKQRLSAGNQRTGFGSLPPSQTKTKRAATEPVEQGQAYGSLPVLQNAGPRAGTSPLTALRMARELNSLSSSNSPPVKVPPDHRSVQGSRSSLRSVEGAPQIARRTSVSFMPFKSPSLSSSPMPAEQGISPSPRASAGRASALTALAEARNPGLAGQAASLPRGSPVVTEAVSALPAASSPRPAPVKYSSSFSHRRNRLSVGGGSSKADDDNNSSGRASISSSTAQPGSSVLAEGGNTSSGSLQTDDDNISDFLKMLEAKKDLKSFQTPSDARAAEAATRRTTAALSKFQRLRDSHAALSDSMTSSQLLHRSSASSSSRQLSNLPQMVAGTSTSIASSPGERTSPRTPHTPAIPSRLSANSIIEYNANERRAGRHRFPEGEGARIQESEADNSPAQELEIGAIPIPTSPRPFHPSFRRSSSVAQQQLRPLALDDDIGDLLPFGMRSASLGDGEEREPLSINALVRPQEDAGPMASGARATRNLELSMERQNSASSQETREEAAARGAPYRPRLGGDAGRGAGPGAGPPGERRRGSGSSDQRGGRHSFTRPGGLGHFEDEEPLLFAMSDFGAGQGQGGRRSAEDGSGSGGSARGGRRQRW